MDIQELFRQAMDRDLPELVEMGKVRLNLGAGNKPIPGVINLDYPAWDADVDPLPYEDGAVDGILAYHFLEHLRNPVAMLVECQRVLRSGGVMQICVPYGTSSMALHDLDHKHFFNEDTWKVLFSTPYYDKNKVDWKFKVHFNLIAGIVGRNLCLLTQLLKEN